MFKITFLKTVKFPNEHIYMGTVLEVQKLEDLKKPIFSSVTEALKQKSNRTYKVEEIKDLVVPNAPDIIEKAKDDVEDVKTVKTVKKIKLKTQ